MLGYCYCSPLADFNSFIENLNVCVHILIEQYSNELFIIGGNFNARISNLNQVEPETIENTYISAKRESLDKEKNHRGNKIVDFFKTMGFAVLSGRMTSTRRNILIAVKEESL